MPIIQCNQRQQPTGKSASNSPNSSISFNPSLSIPTFITCHMNQSDLQEEADKASYCFSEWHCYLCAFQKPFRTHQFKRCLLGNSTWMIPMEYQAVSGSCPSSRPWRPCSGRAHALPVPSSLQIPSVPLTSNFTFFLGKILGPLPKHTPCIVSASCCHHKATWDGWRWGPTTERIQVPGIS